MREADRIECWAVGHTPLAALRASLTASHLAWTVWMDDRPIAMFGVTAVSTVDGRGGVWGLGTDDVFKARRLWFTQAPAFLKAMLGEFRTIENMVAVENHRAVRMLARLGFAFSPDVVYVRGIAFRRFSMGRD